MRFHILGQTKGNQLLGSKFGLPCVSIMEGMHLRLDIWFDLLVMLMNSDGVKGGWLFQHNLSFSSQLFEFEHDFFVTLIEHVQSLMDLIDKYMMDVWDSQVTLLGLHITYPAIDKKRGGV
jgi:hypothetical protein